MAPSIALPLAAALALAAPHAPAAGEPVTYTGDPTHTFVVLEADQRGLATLRARFDRSRGTLTLDRIAGRARLEIEVDAASMGTGAPSLDARWRAPRCSTPQAIRRCASRATRSTSTGASAPWTAC